MAGENLTIRGIDRDVWRLLRVLAVQQGISAGQLANRALREFLERHGRLQAQGSAQQGVSETRPKGGKP